MSKIYPLLIVVVIVFIGGVSIYFLTNQKVQTQTNYNLIQTPTPTTAIINTQSQSVNATPSVSPRTFENMNDFQVMPNGLKIKDETVGSGAEVKSGDTVTVNYLGTLESGTKFDSSYDRNTPFTTQIGVGQVIQGWDEGIVGMKIGGKRKLIIPPELGYGSQGAGGSIPPNSTLIFEVELLNIK